MPGILSALQERFAQLQPRSSAGAALPVYVVEYHHHVLPFIYKHLRKSARSRRPSLSARSHASTVIHIAAHPALLFPRGFDTDRLLDKSYVYDNVNIDTWLLPLVYAGYVDRIFWIRPAWCERIADGDYTFRIGRDQNGVKVDIADEYFVGECMWAPADLLADQKEARLHVGTAKDIDLRSFARHDGQPVFALDIDLDYFSTQNPYAHIFTEKQLAMIRDLYGFEMPASGELLMECAQRRQDQLDDLESIATAYLHRGLTEDSIEYESISDARRAESLALLVRDLERHPPRRAVLTPELIHEAGCMMGLRSSAVLEQHISSHQDILGLCSHLETMLKAIGGRPKTVVISRSVKDNLTPAEDAQFIQESVVNLLQRLYGEIKVNFADDVESRPDPVDGVGHQGEDRSRVPLFSDDSDVDDDDDHNGDEADIDGLGKTSAAALASYSSSGNRHCADSCGQGINTT